MAKNSGKEEIEMKYRLFLMRLILGFNNQTKQLLQIVCLIVCTYYTNTNYPLFVPCT